jgi:stalled ribosome rescue protein Dom34
VWPSEQRQRPITHIVGQPSSLEHIVNGSHHAVVWIDHSGAKVFRFSGDEDTEVDVHSHTSLQRLHHRSTGWEAGDIAPENTEFYQRIMGALDSTGGIVITGPGYEKVKFQAFLDHFRPQLAARVCALETLEHPGAEELLALGRRYFHGTTTAPIGL